ncbi:MAG: response regulator transcription factor [Caldilineaceae bacterium]|nr:response regulator transcription factor [Caldilineaceae bacterium]
MPTDDVRTIRALIVEPHTLMRQTLAYLLASEPEMSIVAETGDGLQALALVQRQRPTIVIMNLLTPGLNSLRTAHRLQQDRLVDHVLLFSHCRQPTVVQRVLKYGAKGYITTATLHQDLAYAVRVVHQGETFVSSGLQHACSAPCYLCKSL